MRTLDPISTLIESVSQKEESTRRSSIMFDMNTMMFFVDPDCVCVSVCVYACV